MEFKARPVEGSVSQYDGNASSRPLRADFDFYTEGDLDYKKELILLMINNLIEFRQTVQLSIDQANQRLFLDACHKAKVTFSILADAEFDEIIERLGREIVQGKIDGDSQTRLDQFFNICELIIISLKKEIDAASPS